MLSPCLASVTTDETATVTTDGIASVPKLVAEVLSVLTVEHSACRDNNIAHDFGLLWFNAWEHDLPTWISVGEDIPALFPALIVTTRLHMSTSWGSSILMVTWGPDWWSCCTLVVLTDTLPEFITVTCKEFGLLIPHESATCQCDSLLVTGRYYNMTRKWSSNAYSNCMGTYM